KIELLSNEAQEIFGKTPVWIVRWGITLVFLILAGIIVGSVFFRYPDIITSTVVFYSETPPASIIARTNGKIDYLFVQNEQQIKSGQMLAILENTANYKQIFELKNKLKQFSAFFSSDNDTSDIDIDLSGQYALGSIQNSFSNFQRQYEEYQDYIALELIDKKVSAIKQQIVDYDRYIECLQVQALNHKKIVQLGYSNYLKDSAALSFKGITPSDFEKSEQNYLQTQNSYQSLLATITNTQLESRQLRYQIVDLNNQKQDQIAHLLNSLEEAYNNLNAAIAEWEKLYVLTSPIEGNVTFIKYWSKNQFVMTSDVVFTIVPTKPNRIIGRLKIPISGSGKVLIGQYTHIELENFPYMEFGRLTGQIESISLVPEVSTSGAFYTAEIVLPEGLKTNYNLMLPFSQGMQGSAEIITKNLSLLDRFIQPLHSMIKKNADEMERKRILEKDKNNFEKKKNLDNH
ncbi:MAG TPA: HlyD family efflux transporter periplasmic adaptor subunit, partial [Bacteroidales bacterium]